MIYTVTFNPSLDYIATVENFTSGTINRTTEEFVFPGGKGINVSMVLSNLGEDTTALGFLAGFTGKEIERLLDEKGITSDFIYIDKGMSRINVKLRSGDESEINGMGPEISEKYMKALFKKLDLLKADDILVLAGSVPKRVPTTIYMDIICSLQSRGIKVVVDATKDLLINVLEYRPFLIKPNKQELEELFERSFYDEADIIKAAKELQNKGARNVLISLAGEGAILITEDGDVIKQKAPKGIVKNSVGAGDAMVAGFLAEYDKSKDYKKAVCYAVCAGSASAFSDALATRSEVNQLMQQLNV